MLHLKNHFQSDVHWAIKKTLPTPPKNPKVAKIASLGYEDRECEVVRP